MTIEPSRPVHNGRRCSILEDDILAALWENAPFPKLPLDAPPEIRDLVVDIENPKRVYTIHRASRRHHLQLLIDRFVVQLRYGCGNSCCSTTTCFTYRKRSAGKSPIRRYNPNSARTLAVYLAGQDNPESRLCPYVQQLSRPSDAIVPLLLAPKQAPSTKERVKARLSPSKNGLDLSSSPIRQTPLQGGGKGDPNPSFTQNVSRTVGNNPVPMKITEKPVGKKDYRSFAAAVFGTVAFKMLEWLAPNNIEALSDQMETSRCSAKPSARSQANLASGNPSEQSIAQGVTKHDKTREETLAQTTNDYREPHSGLGTSLNTTEIHPKSFPEKPPNETGARPPQPRKRSSARIRTSSNSQPSKVVVEPITDSADESKFTDKMPKTAVRPSTRRSTSQPRSEDSSDSNADGRSSTQADREYGESDCVAQINGFEDTPSSEADTRSISLQSEDSCNGDVLEPASELDSYLPQSLSRLNPEAINFLCDVLQEDGTTERHMLEPTTINDSLRHSTNRRKTWKRKRKTHLPYPQTLRYEWKLFAEQSIFNVLSDPQALLESFAGPDGTIDSQMVWYCMLRLTRAAPHLVFDSLWVAVASLFAPPRSLQTSRYSTAKVFTTSQKSFSNAETASLVSICFHALIAAAPLVTESRQLLDMSRIRSRGLLVAGTGGVTEQRTSLSLQYEDAFNNDLALRLARRLLTAILTRHSFDELMELDMDILESAKEPDVLETLLSNLEPSMQSSMRFSKSERSVHEKRVPILLLDWARTVMIQEWTGKPVVPGDGAFGGALTLIAAMCKF